MIDRIVLQRICQCPVCGRGLGSLEMCRECGEKFLDDHGTPRLISKRSAVTVAFPFRSGDSVVDADFVSRRLVESPAASPRKDLPYHLDPWHAEVIAGIPRGSRLLEIGCGGGQMRKWAEGLGLEYVGIDISKTRVFGWLQEHGGPDILADAHFLPFRDDSFDAVYSAAVLEHLACPPRFAIEVARVLRSQGKFMGSVSFLEPWHDDSFFHHSPLAVMELMRIGGFEDFLVSPGWSGYRAMLRMGNALTRRLGVLGAGLDWGYRSTDRLRNRLSSLRGKQPTPMARVRATVAGAMTWVATRPHR
jgi:SAM-dependent methyltransferase